MTVYLSPIACQEYIDAIRKHVFESSGTSNDPPSAISSLLNSWIASDLPLEFCYILVKVALVSWTFDTTPVTEETFFRLLTPLNNVLATMRGSGCLDPNMITRYSRIMEDHIETKLPQRYLDPRQV
jgi:hypothetical protein